MTPALRIVMYHYIRDLPKTSFPRIKGMLIGDFRDQLRTLQARYEMATLESAMAFLQGEYLPSRDLCMVTFDDGLKEHYAEITPLLHEADVQGLFFPITSCLNEHRVAPVHMNHFLMAALDFREYQNAFMRRLRELATPDQVPGAVDRTVAERTYRWDSSEVASFKYLVNFVLNSELRDRVVTALFEERIAEQKAFADDLYLTWEEAREMQAAGMVLGGHSHQHKPLAGLSDKDLGDDLNACSRLLREHLRPQPRWPFTYPYGRENSFNAAAIDHVERLGFDCALSTEPGVNAPGTHVFALRRLNCNDVPIAGRPAAHASA